MGLYGDADLVMTQDITYTRTLVYQINSLPIDWTLYTIVSQVKDYAGNLAFTLTPYFAPLSSDHTKLVLTVPKLVVGTIPSDTRWDLLATLISDPTQVLRTPTPPGRVLVSPGITVI